MPAALLNDLSEKAETEAETVCWVRALIHPNTHIH